jgi:hypothetical protein
MQRCITSCRKFPQTTTSLCPWNTPLRIAPALAVEDGGEGALEVSRAEMSGLRVQKGTLAIVVAGRRRSGWRISVLEREVMVIVEEGLDVELAGAEKDVNSPRTLMRSPRHGNC